MNNTFYSKLDVQYLLCLMGYFNNCKWKLLTFFSDGRAYNMSQRWLVIDTTITVLLICCQEYLFTHICVLWPDIKLRWFLFCFRERQIVCHYCSCKALSSTLTFSYIKQDEYKYLHYNSNNVYYFIFCPLMNNVRILSIKFFFHDYCYT